MEYRIFGERLPGILYRFRPAVYGTAFRDKRILVMENPWGLFLPGGGMDPGERPEACLEREFLEETGWIVTLRSYMGAAGSWYFSPRYREHHFGLAYFYRVDITGVAGTTPEEDHRPLWLEPDRAVRDLYHDHQQYALECLLSENRLP